MKSRKLGGFRPQISLSSSFQAASPQLKCGCNIFPPNLQGGGTFACLISLQQHQIRRYCLVYLQCLLLSSQVLSLGLFIPLPLPMTRILSPYLQVSSHSEAEGSLLQHTPPLFLQIRIQSIAPLVIHISSVLALFILILYEWNWHPCRKDCRQLPLPSSPCSRYSALPFGPSRC